MGSIVSVPDHCLSFYYANCLVTKCTIVMSTVNSDDFDSLIAFASQQICVLHDNLIPSHDCLNPIWINRR